MNRIIPFVTRFKGVLLSSNMTEYKLPLRNRKGEILDYCLVSPEDFEHLKKYYWNKSCGYVKGNVDKQNWLIHRYIIIKILDNDIDSSVHVDHINNNPLDNRRENLRIATSKENNRNKKKLDNTTSKYLYVYYRDIYENKWVANIKHNGKYITAYYSNEIHAAYQVDLWIDEYNIPYAKKIMLNHQMTSFHTNQDQKKLNYHLVFILNIINILSSLIITKNTLI